MDTTRSLLQELGYTDIPAEQAAELESRALEVLQMRIGLRLSQEMTDEQLDQLEPLMPTAEDGEDEMARKQQDVYNWLQQNHPSYSQAVSEEIAKMKQELAGVSGAELSTAL